MTFKPAGSRALGTQSYKCDVAALISATGNAEISATSMVP